MTDEYQAAIELLESSSRFRVLRRLSLNELVGNDVNTQTKSAVFVDFETTGLEPSSEVIEIGMYPFEYSMDGNVVRVGTPVSQLNEPTSPISSEISELTGITNAMVAGCKLDRAVIDAVVGPASLVVAHNAFFDRRFAEGVSEVFQRKPWACTMFDVNWRSEGVEGRRLSDLLFQFGFFFDAHRSIDDCEAGIGLLTLKLPKSGQSVMHELLDGARRVTWRVFAESAPFEMKELLKQRGYRWNALETFGPRSWFNDVLTEQLEGELRFLRREVFQADVEIPVFKVSAFERYSGRGSNSLDLPLSR